MCIVIDTNNISRVFNTSNIEHKNYEPVLNWILKGKGKIIIGGTSFNNEIKKNYRFLVFLQELSKHNKVVSFKEIEVDKLESEIKELIPPSLDFDDPHIVALLKISKCRLICSEDKRAFEYFKSRKIFQGHTPKIYSGLKNQDLLKDSNIANCCKPTLKLNKLSSTTLFNNIITK